MESSAVAPAASAGRSVAAAPPTNTQTQKEIYSIRVMRLPSPTFSTSFSLPFDLCPPTPTPTSSSSSSSPSTTPSLPEQVIGPTLLMPTNIGTVYLGETFRAIISLCCSAPPPYAIYKIELQTANHRWSVHESREDGSANKEIIVEHSLAELGVNCLVCCIQYPSASGALLQYQKFFKFIVHDPFHITTVLHPRDNTIVLEVKLENAMGRIAQIERIDVECSGGISAGPIISAHDDTHELNLLVEEKNNDHNKAYKQTMIWPGTTRNYIVVLKEENDNSKHLTCLGHLHIHWRSSLGMVGRITSSPLVRHLKNVNGDVDVVLVSAPKCIHVNTPFIIVIQCVNRRGEEVRASLSLVKDKMGSLLPVGPSLRQLGPLPAGAAINVTLELVGVGLGVQKFNGFRITTVGNAGTQVQEFENLGCIEIQIDK